MKQPKLAFLETTLSGSDLVAPLLVGGGLGIGARLFRQGMDLKNDKDSPVKYAPVESSAVDVPVEVTQDEAEELERKGVTVKRAATMLDGIAQGGIGALATFGGWKALDTYFDRKRKNRAQERLDTTRRRVERLMSGMPEEPDETLAKVAQICEDEYIRMQKNAILYLPGLAIGAGASLMAADAYNKVTSGNKHHRRAKKIRDYINEMKPERPMAVLRPILKQKTPAPNEDEEKTA